MRLLSLHLHTAFRGLPAGFRIDFRPDSSVTYAQLEPICFVGLNGSGKSNVLQVLAEIFAHIEVWELLRDYTDECVKWLKSDSFAQTVGFTISYTLDAFSWSLAQSENSNLVRYSYDKNTVPVVKIGKQPNRVLEWEIVYAHDTQPDAATQFKSTGKIPLPRHIVGYSSGMNELISNPFIRLNVRYAEQLLLGAAYKEDAAERYSEEAAEDDSEDSVVVHTPSSEFVPDITERSRVIYLDYESNKLITLTNFLFSAIGSNVAVNEDEKENREAQRKRFRLLYDMAGIETIRSFSITINYPYYPDSDEIPQRSIPLPNLLSRTIHKLIYCATAWEGNTPEDDFPSRLRLDFWVNDETKRAFNHHFRTAENLLNELYGLRLLNVLYYSEELRNRIKTSAPDENLSVRLPQPEPQYAPFYVDNLKLVKLDSGQDISYRSLSDGEHQLLHVFGSLMLMEQPGTLFLFDEPETHFNPDWRSRFVNLLNQIVQNTDIERKRQQEILLTSHSPFIVSDCKPENVFVFKPRSDGEIRCKRAADSDFTKAGAFNTFGASERVVLQEVFGYRKSISELVSEQIKKIKQDATSLEKVHQGRQQLLEFGESFEKFDALNYLDSKEEEFSPDPSV